MKLFTRLSGRRRSLTLVAAGALMAGGIVAIPTMAYAAPGCSVTYTKSWENTGGPGFGANIAITNTGDPISGWSLVFNFSGNQQVQGGWPVAFAQSGTQVTISSNADWNRNLATGQRFDVGFNGTFSGTNAIPTTFTLNGTTCNGGGGTPALSATPASQTVAGGANASVTIGRSGATTSAVTVSLTRGGSTVVTCPASVTIAAGAASTTASCTVAAGTTAATSTFTAAATGHTSASFSISRSATTNPALSATPASQTVAGGTTASVTIGRTGSTGAVTVTLTRSGSTVVTCPASVTIASGAASATASCTVAAGTTAASSSFAAAATGHTSASFTISRQGATTGKVNNPYVGATVYNNPDWRARAAAEPGGSRIANQPTGVWMDRRAAITGTTGARGLAAHLDEAVAQDAANGASAMVIQIVIYNLPGRDCSALASNGELGPDDLPIYQSQYIDPIAEIFGRPAYANLRIVAVIEIDSLPNLVTNVAGRPTATDLCTTMLNNGGYVNGVGYALARLGALPNVYNYIDAAHHGWIGWDDNFGATATMMRNAAVASGVSNWQTLVHGFITNTANYSALTEQFVGPITEQLRNTTWIDFNRYNEELAFAQAFRNQLISAGFTGGGSDGIGMLIDTSRNGWGNCVVTPCAQGTGTSANRPTAPSTSTDPNTFVNQSRIDRRIHKGNWCNQAGAGLGERPRAAPASGIDAYVWIKPPGESDGSSTAIPNDEGKGFDRMCDPTYGGNVRNGNSMTGALPNSPLSGHWFPAQFAQLMANAFPPL